MKETNKESKTTTKKRITTTPKKKVSKESKKVVKENKRINFEDIEDYSAAMHTYPTREFLLGKFWDQFNTFGKLPKSTGEKIIELADKIETLTDMREYTDLLVL